MADTALQNAERRRDDLAAMINAAQAQIEEWRREIARIDQFVQDWHVFAGTPQKQAADKNGDAEVGAKEAPAKRATGNADKETVALVARELIELEGKPILRPELLRRLRDRGLVIEGSDPETVLSTMLWRMKDEAQLIHIKRFGYWLSDVPFDPANYVVAATASDSPPTEGSDDQ